jgi:glycosyltransferase involved in cell wall biosynthesis
LTERRAAVHLALVGAFPFPYPQGSQVFFANQARALQAAGARVTLVCYGHGEGTAPGDLTLVRAPFAPRKLASGPSPAKPIADLALAATLARAHRRTPFDAVLAHNAEAALAALLARVAMRRPVVYVAHTVLAFELETYAPPRFASALRRIGAAIDRAVVRRADAVIALARAGERALAPHARGPVRRIPPALTPKPVPAPDAIAAACARHGLEVGRYALYAGNLDGYQDLATLAAAAPAIAAPVVAVTHAAQRAPAPLRTVRVADADELRLLTFGAGVALVARSAAGGFPIKALNYMEASRAIVARASVADPLEQGRSGIVLRDDAPPAAWVAAVNALLADPALAARLGAEARRTLERAHDPAAIARDVLAFVETVRADRAMPSRTW